MEEIRFKSGDVVYLLSEPYNNSQLRSGMRGVVCDCHSSKHCYGVDFGETVTSGHTCHGTCADGRGWYIHSYNLSREQPKEV